LPSSTAAISSAMTFSVRASSSASPKYLAILSSRLGGGPGADEVDFNPGYAVLGLHYVGHVVDGTVAH
jgi:hypothetical protein